MEITNKKKKLLYYGDSPSVATGFGNVARHILSRVLNRYEITVFGINEFFSNPNPLPIKIIPAMPNTENDPFGRKKFISFMLQEGIKYDIWFLQNDVHSWNWLPELAMIIRSKGGNPHIFTYTVVDAPVRLEDTWFLSCVDYAGIPSQYGIDQIVLRDPSLKPKLHHIPHGIDVKEFFPLPREAVNDFRSSVMGCTPGDFLIVNVNRNSHRKDIVRTLLYFGHLRKKYPNVRLYLHMQQDEEFYRGWDFGRILDTNTDWLSGISFPKNFSANQGIDTNILNLIYNSADLVISTTAGEGFGLSCIEAMAAKRLVMMADNSSLSELMAEGRGLPIKCGSTLSEWSIHSHDTGQVRPFCNIEDMLYKTERVMEKYPHDIVERGYQWVTQTLPWEKVINLFVEGFETVDSNPILGGGIVL